MARIKEQECLPVSQQADCQSEEDIAGPEERTKTLEIPVRMLQTLLMPFHTEAPIRT